MAIIGYAASLLMGLSLGMIGGGGSILTVPILVYLFHIDPVLATAYSLFVVGLTALVGGLSYLKKGEVDLKTGFLFAIPSFLGVYATRALLLPKLPLEIFHLGGWLVTKPLLIMLVFAVLMVLASISMIKPQRKPSPSSSLNHSSRFLIIGLEGLFVGTITGFVGAGGGFLIIPALVVLVGLPMKKAVGTSLFIIATKSLIGFLGDWQQSPVIDWSLLFTISTIAVVGLSVGMKLSSRVSESTLKKGFGYFVLLMGCFVLFDQLRRL